MKDRHLEVSEFEGINMAAGMSRVADNKALYMELLLRFAKKGETVPTDIHKLRMAAEYEQLEYLAHGMKGASGNIGAERLYTIFSELEKRSKDGGSDKDFEILEEELTLEMERVLSSIHKACDPQLSPVEASSQSMDTKQLQELIACLKKGSYEGVVLWKQSKAAFRRIYGSKKESIVEQYIREYNFEEAVRELNDL